MRTRVDRKQRSQLMTVLNHLRAGQKTIEHERTTKQFKEARARISIQLSMMRQEHKTVLFFRLLPSSVFLFGCCLFSGARMGSWYSNPSGDTLQGLNECEANLVSSRKPSRAWKYLGDYVTRSRQAHA